MTSTSSTVTVAEIRAAADLLSSDIAPTPMEFNRGLSERVGADVFLKCENLQRAGSFKIRGAYTRMSRLTEEEKARGVVAASAGNHAQGVALAARLLGIEAVVYMPFGAAMPKLAATKGYGATVHQVGTTIDDCIEAAQQHAQDTGAVFIPPFDHPDIIAGQGTAGLEIAEDLPDVEHVFIPVSGGGLASGIGTAVKALCPNATVYGVEPELAGDTAEGLRRGHRVDWSIADRNRTIADGLRSQPSDLTFAHLQRVLDHTVTVSEDHIRSAVRDLALRAHLVSEPSGAVALAGYRSVAPTGPAVAVVSGGNIEAALLREILAG